MQLLHCLQIAVPSVNLNRDKRRFRFQIEADLIKKKNTHLSDLKDFKTFASSDAKTRANYLSISLKKKKKHTQKKNQNHEAKVLNEDLDIGGLSFRNF